MKSRISVAAAVGGCLLAATVWASAGGSKDHPALGAHAEVLEVPRHATDAERFELLSADFSRRQHRIDWKSCSVVKRIRWALRDARRALRSGDAETAELRLDAAQRLLEIY